MNRSPNKRPWLKKVVSAGAAVLLSATLALGAAPISARADDAPIIKLAISSEIDSLNPFTTIYATPINILRYQYESLVEFGINNEVVPGMAESFESSDDGMVWTFKFANGRTWSDGEPLTSADPAWTITQIMTNDAMGAANGSLVTNIAAVEAPDDNTLILRMKTPQAANPGSEIPIVPKHVWEKVDGGNYANDASDGPVVGSGPFYITAYSKGQSIELRANPNFHRGVSKIGGITYVYYNNTEAAVRGLQAGEVDFVSGLSATQFNTLSNTANITASNGAGRRYQAININHGYTDNTGAPMGNGNPVLQDAQVRKAIGMAIDTDTLLERVLGGLGKHGITQQPTTFPAYFGLPDGQAERAFDPAGANAILDAAGYPRGADGVRVDKSGNPINLRIYGRSSDATHAQIVEFLGPWLSEIGIATTTTMKSSSEVGTDSTMGNFDIYLGGWGMSPDPDFQLSINTCAARPNADGSGPATESSWCDPQFDALYAAQHVELDPEKRADLVKQAYGLIYDQNFLIVMYYADALEAYRSDRFTGFQKQPDKTGVIYGQSSYWGLYEAEPVGAAGTGSTGAGSEGGLSTGAIVGIAAGVVVIVGGGALLFARSRGKGQDKE